MPIKTRAVVFALATMIVAPAAARAQGGVPGCTNLLDYNRALGALQGMTSACDMTVEEARRIVAAHDGVAAGEPQTVPGPDAGQRRQRSRSPYP